MTAQVRCCPVAGIGVHFLTPPSSLHPSRALPHLLGLTDQQLQEQMARGHPYGFNLGHGQIFPFNDYLEAARALLERNMPEVFFDRQTKPIFVPEVHLPKMPQAR